MGALLSWLSGGLLRMIPEFLTFFDKKNERKHELSMLDKQMALKQIEAANELSLEKEKHESAVDAGMIQALVEATKAQGSMTGNKFIDGLNILVRPLVTYSIFGLYAIVRITIIVTGISADPHAWAEVLKATWTSDDFELLSGIMGFWFVNRKYKQGDK